MTDTKARPKTRGSTRIGPKVTVGTQTGGKVVGVEWVVNEIDKRILKGDYLDQKTIINIIVPLGSAGLDEITKSAVSRFGVDKRVLEGQAIEPLPEHVSRQIEAIVAAQKASAGKVRLTPDSAYRLGMLAAYDRNYEEALSYFRQATALNPASADAYKAISWLQQSLAVSDLDAGDRDAASVKLHEALDAGLHTDPLDQEALNQRGYVAKTLAQLAEARGDEEDRERYYKEAARFFGHVAELAPNDPGAQNGLGNVQHALGNLDAALAAYRRAIELAPAYAAAHHDLALACEAKMALDVPDAAKWRRKAISEWKQAHLHGQHDPGFTPEDLSRIDSRIRSLEQQG